MIRLLAIIAIVIAVTFFAVRVKRSVAKDVVKEPSAAASTTNPAGPLSFVMKDIDGKELDLATLKGRPVMIVNVASKCGLTKQYSGLEELYRKYKDQGFVILGAPANNFGGQEPGSDEEIKTFCSSKYNVTFPMLSKISVKGDDKHPLYQFLTEEATAGEFAGEIGWNFTKFLIDRNGQIMARFDSKTPPEDEKLIAAVETAIAAK